MSINVKKYTKDQMAKVVEEAAERLESLRSENADLAERLKKETAEKIALRNDLMAKAHSVEELKAKNTALTEQISQMNGEAINKANEIANLKADADVLRNKIADTEAALGRANAELGAAEGALGEMDDLRTKLADTEAALGRANAEVSRLTVGCRQVEEERDYMHQQWSNARWDANYAEAHPWRNLWALLKRKLVRHE